MTEHVTPPLDDLERCIACSKPMEPGDRWLPDVSGGPIHFDCCGPERESFVNADGEPLSPGDPLPTPMIWEEP